MLRQLISKKVILMNQFFPHTTLNGVRRSGPIAGSTGDVRLLCGGGSRTELQLFSKEDMSDLGLSSSNWLVELHSGSPLSLIQAKEVGGNQNIKGAFYGGTQFESISNAASRNEASYRQKSSTKSYIETRSRFANDACANDETRIT